MYRPYQQGRILFWLLLIFALLCFFLSGFFIILDIRVGLIFLFFGLFFLIFSKFFYDISNIIIILESKGLRIIDRKFKDYKYYFWDRHSHAYYIRNYKNFLYLILSSERLSHEEAKFYVKRSETLSKVCIEDIVVFRLDMLGNMDEFINIINNNVSCIDGRELVK